MQFIETRVRLLRDMGIKPRVHPNGFVQLDLSDEERMHVWHPGLPYRQKTFHTIHDHVFSFSSVVRFGKLIHVHYNFDMSRVGKYEVWEGVCVKGEKSRLVKMPGDRTRGWTTVVKAEVFEPGDHYYFRAREFHETMANEPTMTLMGKHGPTAEQGSRHKPRVLVPVGVEPDNDFCRDSVDTDILWDLIMEAMP